MLFSEITIYWHFNETFLSETKCGPNNLLRFLLLDATDADMPDYDEPDTKVVSPAVPVQESAAEVNGTSLASDEIG